MKGDAGDVICVTLESDDRIGISGFDVVEFDIAPASGGKVFFVWRDA